MNTNATTGHRDCRLSVSTRLSAAGKQLSGLVMQRLGNATVMAVDDDPGVRNALDALLTAVDYRFRGFASAEAFLNVTPPPRPCCLLLDVELPGMSGLELQRLLEARGLGRIPIVFLSGGNPHYADRALRAGAVSFLRKPIVHRELLAVIDRALQQSMDSGV